MSMYLYNPTTKHWDIPWQGTGGAARVNLRDSEGIEILPAFVVGTPNVITVGAGDSTVTVGSAKTYELKGLSATSQKVAVKVDVIGNTATAATDYQFNANILLPPVRFSVPESASPLFIHLTRNDAADVPMQVTLG